MEVAFDEPLYRQVLPNAGTPLYLDRSLAPPVHHALFRPTKNDVDGLSLLRSKYRSQVWCGQRPGQLGNCYCLINLQSNELSRIAEACGLGPITFTVSPDDFDRRFREPYAHCVAKEINHTEYISNDAAKKRMKNWAIEVSRSITIDCVIGPFHQLTAEDSYRPSCA